MANHLKKNKVNQALNLNCSNINHSCNRLHLFIAFVCSARNLLDAPWRIHRLKNKNPYKIQALCPKCSAFPLNIFIHPQGGITCPSHCLPPSHPLDPFPSKGMLSLPQLLWPFQSAHLLPGQLADPPGMAEIQQQPHRQQGSGEEEVTCVYSWDQRGQKFISKKVKWGSPSKTEIHLWIVGHLVTLAKVSQKLPMAFSEIEQVSKRKKERKYRALSIGVDLSPFSIMRYC